MVAKDHYKTYEITTPANRSKDNNGATFTIFKSDHECKSMVTSELKRSIADANACFEYVKGLNKNYPSFTYTTMYTGKCWPCA